MIRFLFLFLCCNLTLGADLALEKKIEALTKRVEVLESKKPDRLIEIHRKFEVASKRFANALNSGHHKVNFYVHYFTALEQLKGLFLACETDYRENPEYVNMLGQYERMIDRKWGGRISEQYFFDKALESLGYAGHERFLENFGLPD